MPALGHLSYLLNRFSEREIPDFADFGHFMSSVTDPSALYHRMLPSALADIPALNIIRRPPVEFSAETSF
jgi:hypothetical protein